MRGKVVTRRAPLTECLGMNWLADVDAAPSEIVTGIVVAVLAALGLIYNRAVARLLADYILDWPPTTLPREDRPDRLRLTRESLPFYRAVFRFAVVFTSGLVLVTIAWWELAVIGVLPWPD